MQPIERSMSDTARALRRALRDRGEVIADLVGGGYELVWGVESLGTFEVHADHRDEPFILTCDDPEEWESAVAFLNVRAVRS